MSSDSYHKHLLVYVDDSLCIAHEMAAIMDELATRYRLKDGSVGPPEFHLGADTKITQASSGLEFWAMSSDSYVREAVEIVEQFSSSGLECWAMSSDFYVREAVEAVEQSYESDGKKWK